MLISVISRHNFSFIHAIFLLISLINEYLYTEYNNNIYHNKNQEKTEHIFFFIFSPEMGSCNSSPTCRGRKILAYKLLKKSLYLVLYWQAAWLHKGQGMIRPVPIFLGDHISYYIYFYNHFRYINIVTSIFCNGKPSVSWKTAMKFMIKAVYAKGISACELISSDLMPSSV